LSIQVSFLYGRKVFKLSHHSLHFAVESEKAVLLATEPVEPLLSHLKNFQNNEAYLAWGLYQVFKGISFLHDVGIVHGCLHSGSVFVTPGNLRLFLL